MTVGASLVLGGNILPGNATNQTIVWSVKSTDTIAWIDHDAHTVKYELFTPLEETVTITASIEETYIFTMVSAGNDYTMAIRDDGTLWGWGDNSAGQLGNGTTDSKLEPVQVGTDDDWVYVSAGYRHTAAIRADGTLWTWGSNMFGQLGIASGDLSRITPSEVTGGPWAQVSAGSDHTAAVKKDGTLWTWGCNETGQLGITHLVAENSPTQVRINEANNEWVYVSAGSDHTAAIREDGTLWTWGYNGEGQLGRFPSSVSYSAIPGKITEQGPWASVSAGDHHTAAVKEDGTLWAWGRNTEGQLGLGNSTSADYPEQVKSSGGNDDEWVSVSAGFRYTAAVKGDGEMWTWGQNYYGQLGLDDTDDRYSPVHVGKGDNWASVSAGGNHITALRDDGTLWAWGRNYYGQLGDGSTQLREAPVPFQKVQFTKDFEISVVQKYSVTHTLTSDSGRGTGSVLQVTVRLKAGEEFPAADVRWVTAPENKQFKEWNTHSSGMGTGYSPGAPVTMTPYNLTLYAIWEDILYAVTYSPASISGTGTGTAPAESNKIAGEVFAAAGTTGMTPPSGKQFKEWNTASNGSGTAYAQGADVKMPGNDLTLYAIWEDIRQYTVTYSLTSDSGSGNGTLPTELNKDVGDKFAAAYMTEEITAPIGKQFKEWNTQSNGLGAGYAEGTEVVMPNSNLTLYAIWKDPLLYTVTYSLNTGTGDIPRESNKAAGAVFAAAGATGITPPPGKQFKEWNTRSNGSGTGYEAERAVTMPDDDLTLFAIWEDIRQYTVTYSLISASGTGVGAPPMESNKNAGDEFTLAQITGSSAPDGKQFKEWNTAYDGSETSYTAGTEITMPADNLTLYAVWGEITYPVTYILTSASGTGTGTLPMETAKAAGATFNAAGITGITPPSGKQFREWNTQSSGSGARYAPGAQVTVPPGGITLYAVWEDITYAVTYSLISASGTGTGTAPAETAKIAGAKFSAASADGITPPAGKQFKEWNTQSNGMGTGYREGTEVVMPASALTLYAIWDDVLYAVTYSLTSASGTGTGTAPAEPNRAVGAIFGAAAATGITPPEGMQFKEWNTAADGSGTGYAAGAPVTMLLGGITLYAIWEDITYELTYDVNGGGGAAPAKASLVSGEPFTIAEPTGMTPPAGMQFKEWNGAADGRWISYTPGTIAIMPGNDFTLYAIWEDIAYPVTYDLNGGTGTVPAEPDKIAGATFPAAAATGIIPPEGTQFKQWNTLANGSGNAYTAGMSVPMPASALKLYAIWEDLPRYAVTYELNTGTGTAPTESNKFAGATFSAAPATGMTPPAGMQFKQWNTSDDGSGTAYAQGATVTMPASAFTLYAIWESYRPYAVTYDLNTGTGSAPMEPNKAAGEIFSAAPAMGITPPEGMQFKQWNTSDDGSGTVYAIGAPVTMPSGGITLYAIWEYVTYEVKYIIVNGTWGGSSVEVTETVTHGQTLANIPDNMTPDAAYTSTGGSWGTPAPATSTVVTSAMVFTYTYDVKNTYEVKYIIVNGTWGGTLTEVTETVAHGDTVANIPTNMTPGAAYTPTGGSWGTPAPATSTVVTSAMVFTYTYETMKTYEVTLTPGTGYTLTTSSSTTVTHGGSFTFSFALAADYSNSSFSVFVNDEKITIADGGGYTIPDITGTTTVRVEGVERNVHNFISVPQTSWVKGSAGNFVMTVDTTSVFNDLWMNNVKLTKGTHYTVTPGSTVITILSSYLEALPAGAYSIVAEFVDGISSASLLISAPSGDGGDETGDEEGGDGGGIDMMIIIAIVAVIAIVGIGAVFFLMKKK
jgi:hypothetical protein